MREALCVQVKSTCRSVAMHAVPPTAFFTFFLQGPCSFCLFERIVVRVCRSAFVFGNSSMEASKELDGGLMHRILPPRLEDAGLEDCALPPEAIKEAFFRAANAAKSRAASIFASDEDEESEGCCVKDPLLVEDKPTDVVVGILPELEPPGSCASAKGLEFPDIGKDELIVGGDEIDGEEIRDRLVGGDDRKEGEKPCVDGWQGIAEKGGKSQNNNDGDEKEEDKDAEQPVLTEGFA